MIGARRGQARAGWFSLDHHLLVAAALAAGWLNAVSGFALDHPLAKCITLIPVFVAIRLCRPSSALAIGFIWGTCYFAAYSVIFTSLSWERGLIVAMTPAIFAWSGAFIARRIGYSPFVLAVGWMVSELAFRQCGLSFGATGLETLLGSMIAPLLVGFCVAWVNASIVELTALCITCGIASILKRTNWLQRMVGPLHEAFCLSQGCHGSRQARAPPQQRSFAACSF